MEKSILITGASYHNHPSVTFFHGMEISKQYGMGKEISRASALRLESLLDSGKYRISVSINNHSVTTHINRD